MFPPSPGMSASATFHVDICRNVTSPFKKDELQTQVQEIIEKIKPSELELVDFKIDPRFSGLRDQHVHSVQIYKDLHNGCSSSSSFDGILVNQSINMEESMHMQNDITAGSGPGAGAGLVLEASCNGHSELPVPLAAAGINYRYYVFELNEMGEEEEFMDGDSEEDPLPASHHWILPSKNFHELWDSLFFESDVKSRLLEYVNSALLFSEKGVNNTLITWNKVILLHGPPGSGKTSICKALAQKSTIRLGSRFRYGQLIEINSHSLFSKWFSESGKLIMKMFEKIHELIEDPMALVFLLIDEVESLAQCRMSAEAGNEPSDSIRAVNALLTQIDKMKNYPNVMILTTSNVVGAIDSAFVDRADLKIYIGPPPPEVIYEIYASSINELIRVGIISSHTPLPLRAQDINTNCSEGKALMNIARKSSSMSGRTLRKIPFLTHVNFIRKDSCPMELFLLAMEQAVLRETSEKLALISK